jgi:hypothetical protein
MRDDRLGAYFSGGFGAALVESADIDRASPEKLIEAARKTSCITRISTRRLRSRRND